jgi:hypothetical protein
MMAGLPPGMPEPARLKPLFRRLPTGIRQKVDYRWQGMNGRTAPRLSGRPVRFTGSPAGPFDCLIAMSGGLVLMRDGSLRGLLEGYFFGLGRWGDRWLVFQRVSEFSGQVIGFDLRGGEIDALRIEMTNLNPSVHQICVTGEHIVITETNRNSLLVRRLRGSGPVRFGSRRIYPDGRLKSGRSSANYVHVNSLAAEPDGLSVMFHNDGVKTGRNSEIVMLDGDFRLRDRRTIDAQCAHNIARFRDSAVYCDSLHGRLVVEDQFDVELGYFTRGLDLAGDLALVGGSELSPRDRTKRDKGYLACVDLVQRRVVSELQIFGMGSVNELRLADRSCSSRSGTVESAQGR